MTAAERLSELASILATGLIRLRVRQSSGLSDDRENSCVDFIAHQSGGVSVVARLTELKTMATPDLKGSWRELFATEPPPYNRKFLESRLAYRIQELAYGGLKSQTIERLTALVAQFDGGNIAVRRVRGDDRSIAGTRLIREWQGIEHPVTVLAEGYEWQGRPYQSLSSVARAITGTRWNGWVF